MIEYLTLEDVLALVGDLGVGSVCDIGLLDSAVHRPHAAVFGFYGLNDVTLDAPDDDAYDLVIALASGTTRYQDAATRLAGWH